MDRPDQIREIRMDITSLNDEVVQVLEPNAMYYDAGHDDQNRYFIPAVVIAGLGLLLTSVVLPVISNVLSDELKEKLKNFRERREAEEDVLDEALRHASTGEPPGSDARRAATAAAAAVLFSYGWPQAVADSDGAEIVNKITRSVWAKA